MLIVLIGLRGAGKSVVGALWARARGVAFRDLDEIVVRRLDAGNVREAWSRVGERGFREAEVEALHGALHDPGVLALGGGTPTAPGAEDALRDARARGGTRIVYLRATAAVLRERMGDGGDRPALLGKDALDEVPAVLAARDARYVRLADVVIETSGKSPGEVVGELSKVFSRKTRRTERRNKR